MDLGWVFAIARGVITVVPYVPKALDLTKESLETTKSAMDVFDATKKLVEKDAAEHPEQTVDRVHAMANVTRSLAPLAFAEVLFYLVKVSAVLLLFKWCADVVTKKDAKRIAKKMREEERA